MAISFVASTTKTGISSGSHTWTVNKPSATLYKDVMIAAVHAHGEWNIYPPSGWNLIRVERNDPGSRVALWYKVATVSEPSSYKWSTEYTGGGGMLGNLTIMTYRGVSNSDPIHAKGSNQGSSASLACNITTTISSYLVGASGTYRSGTTSVATSTCGTLTERNDFGSANSTDVFSRALATYDSNGEVAAGSPLSNTFVSNASSNHAVITIALTPASGAPGDDVAISDSTGPAFKVSNKFHSTISRSHRVRSYVEIVAPNGEKKVLEVMDGEVDVDRTAENRRRCSVSCVDPYGVITPDNIGGILNPYGTEIRPYRGVWFGDGTSEVAPLGVFRISKVTLKDTLGSLTIDIEATDLSRTISRDKFVSPYNIVKETSLTQAIKDICGRTFPNMTYNMMSSSRVIETALVYDTGDDPWEALQEISSSLGYDIYFDVLGRLTILPPTDISNLPAAEFTYIEGQDFNLMSVDRVLTDDPGYNGVVVVGESPGDEKPAVTGIAWDDEPSSVTYRKGPYGEVPTIIQDQLVKTEAEATDSAKAHLKNILGFTSQVAIDALTNPLLECGNTVRIKRTASKVDDLYVIDAFNVPLSASGTQSLTLRQKLEVSTPDG